MNKNKHILIGICGGIASYKSVYIISSLVKLGYNVKVVMTKNATKFITPLTLETISKNKIITNLWDLEHNEVEHIKIAQWAHLILIIPATYNTISKIASGIANDALTTIISASTAPTYFAIAMNSAMYSNPILKENIKKLKTYHYKFIEPDKGFLACSSNGLGRLKNEDKIIKIILNEFNQKNYLKNKKILITASRTEELIDPIRYFSNTSTGKMGFCLAQEAIKLGAQVTIITGPTNENEPKGVNIIKIKTAMEMYKEVLKIYNKFEIIIGAAAVADFRPKHIFNSKIKKSKINRLYIKLVKNPDIIQHIGHNKLKNQIVVGFCAENSKNLIQKAKEKLKNKNLDFIIANELKYFGSSLNKVYIINKQSIKELPEMEKSEVAKEILKILY
ncbi:bifunctional phosphopantothenoylcysteine decarboxylase/phosphopantothenate--cysteine ligase CoaBC [Borreliella spielmanii]|uniref:Coenzyme A biosynthesis bifunctional protein CoaBC n=1 Tax=Borreliella spielmanii A14S TaxID=498742 RepID=B9X7J8_9SPIR|nr:bifunctional phosphopantothenoylcysteine decarboxylase/phosphopantothenate--cysteine ligase CoaBC [Borreliella spielmanii]EEF84895.1 phosphopantothenoylcysteine decarboxylase/phosphopantothenate--cysteine ligase [Borreliella spielmanii A14S]WKC83857.1 bifunctional phosphopantothenoylcysteine decarboxylase/phosphopantothenate--cysteine ligase CoaBC [Borreliella spielmanii]